MVPLKVKDYQCDECSKAFGQKGDLQRHIKTVHEVNKDVQWVKYSKSFRKKVYLLKHIQIVHEDFRIHI